jgi:hypothetical protein
VNAVVTEKVHRCTKEAEIAVINERQAQMMQKINDIHKIVVGNGKPGLMEELKTISLQQEVHKETINKHSNIIDKLNLKLAYYAGGIAVIIFIVTLLANKVSALFSFL